MDHIGDNVFCGFDLETTGFSPVDHEVIEVAIIPFDSRLNPLKKQFHIYIKPEKFHTIDLEAVKIQSVNKDDPKANKYKNKLSLVCDRGVDRHKVADLLYAWFEDLRFAPSTRLIPIGSNLKFDIQFMEALLGTKAYSGLFDIKFRDVGLYASNINDKAMFKNMPIPFKYTNMKYLTKFFNLNDGFDAHNAVDDAYMAVKIYKNLLAFAV